MYYLNYIFSEYSNLIFVLLGLSLLAISTSIIGNFIVLKKQALMGDAVSHAVLPGLVLAYIFTQTKNTLILLIGAFISGWISVFLIDWIISHSKIKYDAALAITLTAFFGAGMVLLTFVQQNEIGNSAGLEHYIFGSATSLIGDDLTTLSILTIIILGFSYFFYKELMTFTFSESYFQSISHAYKFIKSLYLTLFVATIVIGISVFGVVLISALLITPSISASFWTHSLKSRILLSCIFSVLSAIAAAITSLYIDNLPTGPLVIIFLGFFMLGSILLGKHSFLIQKRTL